MDNRLIFLYRMVTELWGHGRETWAGNGKSGTNGVVAQQANPLCMRRSRDVERTKVVKHVPPSCREKPLLFAMRPYRKPTQVDEERILRPAGEALSRNSAK